MRARAILAVLAALVLGGAGGGARAARAAEIAIAQYGNSTSAMPWAIALAKGYFKDAGVDITGIRSSSGGSADIRNMLAGGLPYAESALASVVTASRAGADVKMVSENVDTVANFVWATTLASPIKSFADIRGKRLTYTTPQSTTEIVQHLLVAKLGLKNSDVTYVATGPYGAALTALETGGADVALLAEPIFSLNKGRFRALGWARDELPPLVSTVGVVPTEIARAHPGEIRAILIAHRRAVEFMRSHRKELAAIIAHVYKLDPALVLTVLNELIDHPSAGNVPYWGLGNFYPAGFDTMMKGLALVKAVQGGPDWRTLVDQRFLPKDLQRPL